MGSSQFGSRSASQPNRCLLLELAVSTACQHRQLNWLLSWYFNFHNQRGLAFHEFALPGLPASHACIRLLRRDAQWLFGWGEGWELGTEGREVLRHGTPVWIVGEYDFSAAPPWLNPEWWDAPIRLPDNILPVMRSGHRANRETYGAEPTALIYRRARSGRQRPALEAQRPVA